VIGIEQKRKNDSALNVLRSCHYDADARRVCNS